MNGRITNETEELRKALIVALAGNASVVNGRVSQFEGILSDGEINRRNAKRVVSQTNAIIEELQENERRRT